MYLSLWIFHWTWFHILLLGPLAWNSASESLFMTLLNSYSFSYSQVVSFRGLGWMPSPQQILPLFLQIPGQNVIYLFFLIPLVPPAIFLGGSLISSYFDLQYHPIVEYKFPKDNECSVFVFVPKIRHGASHIVWSVCWICVPCYIFPTRTVQSPWE